MYKIGYEYREAILEVDLTKLSRCKIIFIIFQEFMLSYLSVYDSVELRFCQEFIRILSSYITSSAIFVWRVFKVISPSINATSNRL